MIISNHELIALAIEARKRAYTPYSRFQVGAALLGADDKVYLGCNIENAAYGPSNCAERTAFFKAVSEGCRSFQRIAIVGGPEGGPMAFTAPCGVCRQVMREFCDPETFEIILGITPDNYRCYRLRELFPESFGPDNLKE